MEASTQAYAVDAAPRHSSEDVNLSVSADVTGAARYTDSCCAVHAVSVEDGAVNATTIEIASKPHSPVADSPNLYTRGKRKSEATASPTFGRYTHNFPIPDSFAAICYPTVWRSAYMHSRRPFFRTSHTPALLPQTPYSFQRPVRKFASSADGYRSLARQAENPWIEADMLDNVRKIHSQAQQKFEHSMEVLLGAERGKLLMQGASPDAIDNLELKRYREHVLAMHSWDQSCPSEGSADQDYPAISTVVAREEKARLQGAHEKSGKEWGALQQRLKSLNFSDSSKASLQRANREELSIVSDLAKLEEQRKKRYERHVSPEPEKPESVESEQRIEVTDDEVVLLSDSEEEDEAAQSGGEDSGASEGEEEASIDELELHQPDSDDSGVRPLSHREMVTYQRILSSHGPEAEVLAVHPVSKEELLRSDFVRLAPGTWLSDEAINMYMRLLQQRDTRLRALGLAHIPKCHFFSSFFFCKLYSDRKQYNYQAVQKWTRPARLSSALQASKTILDCDKIFVPIHQPSHWCMAVIDLKEKCLRYYDSLHGRDKKCLEALAMYIKDEAADKAGVTLDTSSWRKEFPDYIPSQRNGYDCGMFAVKFADYEARGRDFTFSQADMPLFRKRMVSELSNMVAW
mmetsp:Transcript_326/g.864  ORF Transcript_326/g.864 Transcript_326/m.864 type:complete len:631 (+) Transcript_326:272-2164(+)